MCPCDHPRFIIQAAHNSTMLLDISGPLGYGRMKMTMRKKTIYQYTVFIEPCEEGGYFATCPSLPGCHVQGERLEDTLNEMKAVIDAYLEDLR